MVRSAGYSPKRGKNPTWVDRLYGTAPDFSIEQPRSVKNRII